IAFFHLNYKLLNQSLFFALTGCAIACPGGTFPLLPAVWVCTSANIVGNLFIVAFGRSYQKICLNLYTTKNQYLAQANNDAAPMKPDIVLYRFNYNRGLRALIGTRFARALTCL